MSRSNIQHHSLVFQVKSGGHASNPGFSSTKGIHIYTGKFSQVAYDAVSGTAVIGTGLVWETVYQQLQDHRVSVLGGRANGVSECRDFLSRSILNPVSTPSRNRSAWVASYSAEVGS